MVRRLVAAPAFTGQLANRALAGVQQVLRLQQPFDISIVLVGDARMMKLNAQHRKQAKVTDVLSFPYGAASGEVVICYPQAKRQAQAKQQPLKRELSWLLIHGILHVLGYDHEQAKDALVMRPLEQSILRQLHLV